eukprot:Filipodium_phascolosomae@DN1594_c0_g1_i1.p1
MAFYQAAAYSTSGEELASRFPLTSVGERESFDETGRSSFGYDSSPYMLKNVVLHSKQRLENPVTHTHTTTTTTTQNLKHPHLPDIDSSVSSLAYYQHESHNEYNKYFQIPKPTQSNKSFNLRSKQSLPSSRKSWGGADILRSNGDNEIRPDLTAPNNIDDSSRGNAQSYLRRSYVPTRSGYPGTFSYAQDRSNETTYGYSFEHARVPNNPNNRQRGWFGQRPGSPPPRAPVPDFNARNSPPRNCKPVVSNKQSTGCCEWFCLFNSCQYPYGR